MTKAAKPSPKKRNASQEKKKENNIQLSSSLGSFSNKESSIAVISKSTKLAHGNSKGLQSCLDEALKTYKPKKVKQRQENSIQSCSKSSDNDVNLSNSVASTSKPTRNTNSSPRKGKRRTDSTSPLRRSPRKSVQLQRKVIFFMRVYYIFFNFYIPTI